MKFSVITVCHKSSKIIVGYLNSFLCYQSKKSNIHEYEFIFVENSGDDGIVAAVDSLKQASFSVKIINSENYGFGAGCNLGASAAQGKTLLFVNSDIQFLGNMDGLAKFVGYNMWGTVCQLREGGNVYSFDLLPEYKYRHLSYALLNVHLFINRFIKILSYCYVVGLFLVVIEGFLRNLVALIRISFFIMRKQNYAAGRKSWPGFHSMLPQSAFFMKALGLMRHPPKHAGMKRMDF